MDRDLFVLLTMDCETARKDVTAHAARMSPSGPWDYAESERSIRGFAARAKAHGFPVTYFVHPEVGFANRDLLLELQDQGACLGLHLHPYKLGDGRYEHDLGAYTAAEQRDILGAATAAWHEALGQEPRYFRAGYFSANDATFAVLRELGFRGGSLSIPGRILPAHCSVWAGAEPYAHRAHLGFRQQAGNSDFVEVPVSVDFLRPVQVGAAGEIGYEWPYVPARYQHREVVEHILQRAKSDAAPYGAIVLDTHNDQDYPDPGHPASLNLELILSNIRARCRELGLRPVGATVQAMCDRVLAAGAT